jgi:hypothetical protein
LISAKIFLDKQKPPVLKDDQQSITLYEEGAKMKKIVTLSKGGTKERKEHVDKIQIPDLYKIAELLKTDTKYIGRTTRQFMGNQILETWHLAHDLKRHIQESK